MNSKTLKQRCLSPGLSVATLIIGCGLPVSALSPARMPPPQQADSSSQPASTAQLEPTYQALKLVWDDCNQLQNMASDILNEGKNSPPRKSWLDFYLDTVSGTSAKLETDWKNTPFPASMQDSLSKSQSEIQSAIGEIKSSLPNLQKTIQAESTKNQNAYPEPFWAPAQSLQQSANKLDASVTAMLATLSASTAGNQSDGSASARTSASSGGGASTTTLKGKASKVQLDTGLKSVGEAGKRISDACTGMIGELERWNLLYGHPPQGGTQDMFYGGGLTAPEVMSQYRYLPTTVFTMPAYVKLYSYRLPPRQNMLVHFTTQIGKLMNMMQNELESINIGSDEQEAIGGPWDAVKRSYVDSRNQYLALLKLVNASSDAQLQKSIREDEVTLGAPVVAIFDDMGKLQHDIDDIKKAVGAK